MNKKSYIWTDNPTVSGVSICDTDILNDCLMHLKYNHSSDAGLAIGDIVEKDHILSFEESEGLALLGTYVYKTAVAGSRYGYPDFYEKYVDYKNNSEANETTLGDSTITIYNNSNGLKFYDIANKSVVDSWFESTGEAMFYGIDEENERIFLPRRTRTQATLDTSKVNDYMEAGLPNITGTTSEFDVTGNNPSGAFTQTNNSSYKFAGGSASAAARNNFDASLSNPIYGNSDTVQPSCSLVLEYMIVGNVKNTEGFSDVVAQGTEILTQVNQGLETRLNLDISNISQSGKEKIIDWGLPDYSAGIAQTMDTKYIASCSGYVVFQAHYANSIMKLYVNDTVIEADAGEFNQLKTLSAYVSVGDTYKTEGGNITTQSSYTPSGLMFYPLKGAN